MKKLLSIIVLGLLLSGNAYASNHNLIVICKTKIAVQNGSEGVRLYLRTINQYDKEKNHPFYSDGQICFLVVSKTQSPNLFKKLSSYKNHGNAIWGSEMKRIKSSYKKEFERLFALKKKDPNNYYATENERLEGKRKVINKELAPFKEMCRNIGYSDGTEKFADCVKDLYLKKLDADQSQATTSTTTSSQPKRRIDPSVWDDLLGISKGLLGGKSGSSSSTSSLSCFKTSERVSGTNKICSYNCMGSEVTRNIRSTQICPISIKN
jgi:hypothetical protein